MDQEKILEIAHYLLSAEENRQDIPKITNTLLPSLTIPDAYQIQDALIQLKIENGNKIVGPKMGITSKAKMEQMHVDKPIYGYVFDYMLVDNNAAFSTLDYIHPKVEPEIGFILKEDLVGPEVTIEDVLSKTESVFSCVEIIDSRYQNFDFTLPDVIADNTSARGAVFSEEMVSVQGMDLSKEKVTLSINGVVKAEGDGTAVLGHPAEAIVQLAYLMAEKGQVVPKGQPIMTGGITAAIQVNKGDLIEVTYSNLGKVTFTAN